MATYCYTNGDETIERDYPMGEAPKRVRHQGRWYKKNIAATHSGTRSGEHGWPMWSDFAGCHPSQKAEMERRSAEAGCPVRVNVLGQVELLNRKHRHDFLRFRGMFDRDAGYGDPAPLVYQGD